MSKPTLYRGTFRGTDSNGNDVYGADYYLTREVDEYVEQLQTQIKTIQKCNGRQYNMIEELQKENECLQRRVDMLVNESAARFKSSLRARVSACGGEK